MSAPSSDGKDAVTSKGPGIEAHAVARLFLFGAAGSITPGEAARIACAEILRLNDEANRANALPPKPRSEGGTPIEFHSAGHFHPDAIVCSAKQTEALERALADMEADRDRCAALMVTASNKGWREITK